MARNSGASSHTVTIDAVADSFGRGGAAQISAQAVAAGAIRTFGPFGVDGWRQTDGYLYIEANHSEILFSVIRLP